MPCRFIFGEFCNFLMVMSAQVFVSTQNPAKITLPGICHSSAPIGATKVHKVSFKDNGPSNISVKSFFSEKKIFFLVLAEVEVHILVF